MPTVSNPQPNDNDDGVGCCGMAEHIAERCLIEARSDPIKAILLVRRTVPGKIAQAEVISAIGNWMADAWHQELRR